jgi:N-formylglutamate amidohydrolase
VGQGAEAGPFSILAPGRWDRPAVFNSPHSGRQYPQSFLALSRLDAHALRKSEDCYIDDLFSFAADLGAPLLRAHFPRAFLDVNREPYELDPRMFREELPGFANVTSTRVACGLGTIPRIVSEGDEIYRGPLTLSEALNRIENIYRPYHHTLADLITSAQKAFGFALLVDCHSMPSTACSHVSPYPPGRVDAVIGDRHGAACSDEIIAMLEELMRGHGLRVVRNKPYSGGFITQNYGAPANGRHAIQIEINRALYLDERTLDRSRGYEALRTALRRIFGALLNWLPDAMQPRLAAE